MLAIMPVLLLTNNVIAQTDQYTIDYNNEVEAVFTSVFIFIAFFYLCTIIVMLAFTIPLTIWMNKETKQRKDPNAGLWTISVLLCGIFGFMFFSFFGIIIVLIPVIIYLLKNKD